MLGAARRSIHPRLSVSGAGHPQRLGTGAGGPGKCETVGESQPALIVMDSCHHLPPHPSRWRSVGHAGIRGPHRQTLRHEGMSTLEAFTALCDEDFKLSGVDRAQCRAIKLEVQALAFVRGPS
eukprot:COSAG01_NODE_215_length_21709_cov_141.101217_16_plen_123_part_00